MVTVNDSVSRVYRSAADQAIAEFADARGLSEYTRIFARADSNNDVNGSQHHPFTVYFTYRDATEEDVANATSLGYYEYFREYGCDEYTGNQYEGYGGFVDAIVVDPPGYAVEESW